MKILILSNMRECFCLVLQENRRWLDYEVNPFREGVVGHIDDFIESPDFAKDFLATL